MMKSCLKLVWKWSWVITLPIVCAAIYWGWFTAERFYTFGLRYNPAPASYHLHSSGVKEFRSLYRKTELAVSNLRDKENNHTRGLKVINLFVPESSLAKLNSNLPYSGNEYVKGRIWNRDKLQKIKIKYRGDFVYHWGDQKKSFRVKTSKSNLIDGIRTFNLIAPKQLSTHLGCLLAKEMGLIAPRTEMVEVTLNGKLLGVYAYVEQLEELTLRENGLMPGDLYAGELIGKDLYRGTDNRIFNHPGLWEKVAVNNHYDQEARKPLEKLLGLLTNRNLEQAQKELLELIDVQAWGLMAAFETLTQSFHYDNHHNWRLYYDPMKSRFYPVIWDPNAWHSSGMPPEGTEAQLDIIPSVMHQFLYQNAAFLKERAQALQEFFRDGKDKEFLGQAEHIFHELEKANRRDPNPSNSPAVFKNNIKRIFADVKRHYFDNATPLEYSLIRDDSTDFHMALSVSGRIPVRALSLAFAKPLNGPVTGRLIYNVNGKEFKKDISGAITQSGSTLEIRKTLISDHQRVSVGTSPLKRNRLEIQPAYYELILSGLNNSNRLIDVRAEHGDVQLTSAELVASLKKKSFVSLYGVLDAQAIEEPLVWQGVVDIVDVREVKKPLIIEPGTVIRFSPGSGLILRNRLFAEGTAEKPISFVPMNKDSEPWGTLAIRGNKANRSHLKYCQFEGGSGLKGDLFEYTAMLSIHDVKGVVIENCKFRDSRITDDMVHVVYSEIFFRDCVFERSLMDALDIDICEAVIERCHFTDSGNDAIDLMTSNTIVFDTLIEKSGDKATSVGEGSHMLAINNLFKENVIGVQVKDGSIASLYNTDLKGNGHALDAYKKNWRYDDGGKIFFYKGRLLNNTDMITADKKSKIRIFDSYLDRIVASTKNVKIDITVDQINSQKPYNSELSRHKKDIELMKGFNPKYWGSIDTARRGALNFDNH